MATASRPKGPKTRSGTSSVSVMLAFDAVRPWLIPGLAAAAIVVSAALASAGLVSTPVGLAIAIAGALVLLLYIGMRPLVAAEKPPRGRALGAALGIVWLFACYVPFHVRLFPGVPLVDDVQVTAGGQGLPLRIPAAGHAAIDLLLEGHLAPNPSGGAALPVHYVLTLEDGAGTRQLIDGDFKDTLATRRLGRRGTAVVHQAHTGDVRVLPNPTRQDLRVTAVTLDPPSAQPVTLTAYAHPLPGSIVLGLVVAALVAAVVAFDRLGPAPETDGALTLATAAILGTAAIFWTSNVVHPDFSSVIGSAIFGGPLGFAAGALLWWVAKRTLERSTR